MLWTGHEQASSHVDLSCRASLAASLGRFGPRRTEPQPPSDERDWGSVTRVHSRDKVSRRRLLGGTAAFAVGLLTGCANSADVPRSRTSTRPGPSAAIPEQQEIAQSLTLQTADDVALALDAIASEEALAAFGATAATIHPQLSAVLDLVRTRGRAHAVLLREALVDFEAPHAGQPAVVPRTPRATYSKLISLLTAAEEQRLAGCLASESGLLARVFASMSASHAAAAAQLSATSSGPAS